MSKLYLYRSIFLIPSVAFVNDNLFSIVAIKKKNAALPEWYQVKLEADSYVYVLLFRNFSRMEVKRGEYISCYHPFDPSTILVRKIISIQKSNIISKDMSGETTINYVPQGHAWVGLESVSDDTSSEFGPVNCFQIIIN